MDDVIISNEIDEFFSELCLQKPKQPDFHLMTEQDPHSFCEVLRNNDGAIDAVVIWWEASSSLIVSDVRSRRSLSVNEVGRIFRVVTQRAKQLFVHKSYVEEGVDSCLVNSLKARGFQPRT